MREIREVNLKLFRDFSGDRARSQIERFHPKTQCRRSGQLPDTGHEMGEEDAAVSLQIGWPSQSKSACELSASPAHLS